MARGVGSRHGSTSTPATSIEQGGCSASLSWNRCGYCGNGRKLVPLTPPYNASSVSKSCLRKSYVDDCGDVSRYSDTISATLERNCGPWLCAQHVPSSFSIRRIPFCSGSM